MKMRKYFILLGMLFLWINQGHSQNWLSVSDPRNSWEWSPGWVESMTVTVHPKGIYSEVGLYLEFSAGSMFEKSDTLEIVYKFTLPPNALVVDSWLWIEDSIVQAEIRDRWTASAIYEGIVQRRRDPSILNPNRAPYQNGS